MKVLYAIQGTGNGHVCRAMHILPELKKYAEVDVLISGIQTDINFDHAVRFRYKGLSFIFGEKGGIDYIQTIKRNSFISVFREMAQIPVQNYDLIINDFEPITAWAAKFRGVPIVSMSHQSSLFSSNCPRPGHKDLIGKWILKYYAPSSICYGFHFEKYAENVFYPIIRNAVREQTLCNKGHYTIYLPAYGDALIHKVLVNFPDHKWHVFSKHAEKDYLLGNIHFFKLNSALFVKSMSNSAGIICGAGFETPAEALHLGIKLLVVPMKKQYEQHFNVAALKRLGVTTLNNFDINQLTKLKNWIDNTEAIQLTYPDETAQLIQKVFSDFSHHFIKKKKKHFLSHIRPTNQSFRPSLNPVNTDTLS